MGNILVVPHWNEERLNYLISCTKKAIEVGKFTHPYSIISVGSGTGEYEKKIADAVFDPHSYHPDLICVDPLHDDYSSSEMVIKPHFSNVDEMLETHPNVIQNCILMLFWPYDQGHMNCISPGKTPYDIDAISKLKPRSIVILYEEYGAAGSNLLHAWISQYSYLNSCTYGFDALDTVNEHILYSQHQYKFLMKNKWHYGESTPLHCDEKSIICGLFVRKEDIGETYDQTPRLSIEVPSPEDIKCDQKANQNEEQATNLETSSEEKICDAIVNFKIHDETPEPIEKFTPQKRKFQVEEVEEID